MIRRLPPRSMRRSSNRRKVDASKLTIDRIYVGKEFDGKSFDGRWLDGQSAYVTLEPSESVNGGRDIVRHDAATGESTVMVAATDLTPAGEDSPLKIESYQWSKDHNLLLVFTNSKRVWRNNTRGDYWLLDRSSRQLRKLGGDAPPASLMFAKLSPTGKQIAYVRDRNLYVEDLFDHTVRQLTQSESQDVINGTTDWVYEEELGLRDAFRWSPDGQWIAYWQINTEGVEKFPLVNNTDSLYPTVNWFAYPKVGQRNPSCRVGMIQCESTETRWIELPGDPSEHYVPRIEFLPTAEDVVDDHPRLLIQQLNRLQNTNRLLLADFRSATVSDVMTEQDEAWVDVHDELKWIDSAKRFTWLSDRDGWRHIYIASLDGGQPTLVTPGNFDVIELLQVDEKQGDQKGSGIYFIASPDSASERYLYRVGLDGSDLKRITPAGFIGTHSYQISPDANWAIHTQSCSDLPPVTDLVSLDDHQVVRVLENNEELLAKVEQLSRSPTEFFSVEIGDGVELDAWCIKPPDFDPAKKYPLLCYVYGEPAGSTVVNRWGGKSYSLALDARTARLCRDEFRQSRHESTTRSGVSKEHLQEDRHPAAAGSSGRGESRVGIQILPGPRSRWRMGMERRRFVQSACDLQVPRSLFDGDRCRAGSKSTLLRYDLSRAIHESAGTECRGIPSRFADQLRQKFARESIARAWHRRRQLPLSDHRNVDRRTRCKQQTVQFDGLSESNAFDPGTQEHDTALA